jgi:hypothetical protein
MYQPNVCSSWSNGDSSVRLLDNKLCGLKCISEEDGQVSTSSLHAQKQAKGFTDTQPRVFDEAEVE